MSCRKIKGYTASTSTAPPSSTITPAVAAAAAAASLSASIAMGPLATNDTSANISAGPSSPSMQASVASLPADAMLTLAPSFSSDDDDLVALLKLEDVMPGELSPDLLFKLIDRAKSMPAFSEKGLEVLMSRYSAMRQKLERSTGQARQGPASPIVFIGSEGVGKSTTLNQVRST